MPRHYFGLLDHPGPYQQGKGATMGAAFGSGASSTVFGSSGSGGFMIKLTGLFAALFFITSLILGYMAVQQSRAESVPVTAPVTQPATHFPAAPLAQKKAAIPAADKKVSPSSDTSAKKSAS